MTSSPASESLEHARFAVVDVETTGVRAQVGGRILEVAVAILEGGTIHLAFEALLDPGTPIPLWVARLTGITDGMVAGRPVSGTSWPVSDEHWMPRCSSPTTRPSTGASS